MNSTLQDYGSTENVSATVMPEIRKWVIMLYLTAACTIIITITGIAGNLLTIVALVKSPRVRNNATSAFIISLSLADFFFCTVNLPFSATRFIYHTWIHGESLCIIFPYLRYVNVGLSLLSIAAITVNRYILIVHPSRYERMFQKKYIAVNIVLIWLFSFAMLIPTLIGKWGRFGFDEKILNCSILTVNGKSPKTFLFVFGFLVPCLVIVFCYVRIFWVMRRSKSKVRKHSSADNKSKEQVKKEANKRRNELKITQMILIIFCSFVICYLPITVVKVADKNVKFPALHLFSYIMIYMSACVNPLIYGVTNNQYRQAYKNVLLWIKNGVMNIGRRIRHPSQSSSSPNGTAVYTLNSKSGINSNDSVFANNEQKV